MQFKFDYIQSKKTKELELTGAVVFGQRGAHSAFELAVENEKRPEKISKCLFHNLF